MDKIQEILSRYGNTASTFENMTPREYEQFKVDGLNATEGTRHLEDGYECKVCRNKGYIVKIEEDAAGILHQVCTDCKCVPVRRSIMRMKRSGLKDIIRDYTFDLFEDKEQWQKSVKSAAMEYAEHPEGWFFLGGQSGSGKTHLCTAICREFLLKGREVLYMLWRDDIVKIKAAVTDSQEYSSMIDRYKKAEVLYIDDLFKTGKGPNNSTQLPTPADINVAFEIINYRYCNPELLTIISTELSVEELIDIDEATGGRIFERAKTISISKDRSRNYRLNRAVTI